MTAARVFVRALQLRGAVLSPEAGVPGSGVRRGVLAQAAGVVAGEGGASLAGGGGAVQVAGGGGPPLGDAGQALHAGARGEHMLVGALPRVPRFTSHRSVVQ